MSAEETVKLEIHLAWSYAYGATYTEEYDTQITVSDWNAMSEEERAAIGDTAYGEALSNQAMGGVRVITEGAAE